MNYLLWEVQKSTNCLSEALMLRINQYVGFMPPRSTHDSPFFRELVNRRSRTQERQAEWLRRNTETINWLQGIITCIYCLCNVTCDLDGKPHNHNCDRNRMRNRNEYQPHLQLYEGARNRTAKGSKERDDQEQKILKCPACERIHYLPPISVQVAGDDANATIRDYHELCMYCADPTKTTLKHVPPQLHWAQGQGCRFPADHHHGYPPEDLARWDWREHSIVHEFCSLCLGPGHTPGTDDCPMTPILRRAAARERTKGTHFLKDPLGYWVMNATAIRYRRAKWCRKKEITNESPYQINEHDQGFHGPDVWLAAQSYQTGQSC
jgi:hypothetical protein